MKTAVVPAQITTVEDRVAGNLTLQQLLLMAAPIFINFALFIVLPKPLHFTAYKSVLMTLVTVLCLVSAIRFKGKLLLIWALALTRYNLRPRYYVYNKNDEYLREIESETEESESADEQVAVEQPGAPLLPAMSTLELVKLEDIMADPAANVSFITKKKGGLHVSATEIKR